MEWMLLPFKRYADFNGRSRRMEYWMFAVFNLIVFAVLGGITFAGMGNLDALMAPGSTAAPEFGPMVYLGGGLLGLYVLATIVPNIAVVVRRLHDRDMSGWWYLGVIVAGMIPLVGILANIGFLVLMFLPGTVGPNRFGPDPKDPASVDVFS